MFDGTVILDSDLLPGLSMVSAGVQVLLFFLSILIETLRRPLDRRSRVQISQLHCMAEGKLMDEVAQQSNSG